MFYQLKDTINRTWFDFQCRGILSVPPIEIKKNGLLILSMVSHKDVIMYLIAIKSFYHHLRRGEILVVNDGSLTVEDRTILQQHIPSITLVHIKDINTGVCPKGGTWERHVLIADYVKDYYVIQLDADTVTANEIPEVIECLNSNTSYAISGLKEEEVREMRYSCDRAKSWGLKKWNMNNIQFLSEMKFENLKDYNNLKYARCGASFAGFAKNSFTREKVERFSLEMERITGKKWHTWGSEQVTSNFIVANSPKATVLPYPKYISFFPYLDIDFNTSAFVHLIGANRFKQGFYKQQAKEIIKLLKRGAS